jgi:hypothetical protein
MNQSFRSIFASAPLGTVVAFSDGTPRPPERFNKKLRAWKSRNGTGLLVSKRASEGVREWDKDRFTLCIGEYRSGMIVALIVNMTYSTDSDLTFAVERYDEAGRFALLTHSEHVGTEYKGSFATLAEAEADIERGHRYSKTEICRVGENGELLKLELA